MSNYAYVLEEVSKLSLIDFNKLKNRLPLIESKIKSQRIECCPYCKKTNIVGNGKYKDTRRYYCKDCAKYFRSTTSNITFNSSKFSKLLPNLIEELYNQNSLRNIAYKLNISLATSFNYRHKLLKLIEDNNIKYLLKDIVEVDEMFIPINLKGTKVDNMPRLSKERKTPTVSRKELVCIETGIDTKRDLIIEIAGTSTISIERFNKVFDNFICNDAFFVGDSARAYRSFVIKYSMKHEFIPSGKHKSKSGYTLSSVNERHSSCKIFLKPYRGVSTRHLSKYISLFKYINDNTDYTSNMYNLCISNKSPIKNKEICITPMPIDIESIYSSDIIKLRYDEKWYRYKH
jgi:transposase-like protein